MKISQKAMDLIAKYKEKFPEVFSVLRCKHYSKQFYPDEFSRDTMKRLLPAEELAGHGHQQQQKPRAPAVGPFANPDTNTSVTGNTSVRSSSVVTSALTMTSSGVMPDGGNGSASSSSSSSLSSVSIAMEEKSQSVSTAMNSTISSVDLMSEHVQHCGVEEVEEEVIEMTMEAEAEEEEEEVIDMSAPAGTSKVQQEVTVDMSAVPNVAELSAEGLLFYSLYTQCGFTIGH